MASAISIHPAVDEGVKPGTEDFPAGRLSANAIKKPWRLRLRGIVQQPCLRLHEVLETCRGCLLNSRMRIKR